jgi:hypothetical protein
VAELVVQPDLGDAVDVAQALGELEVRVAGQRRSKVAMISALFRPCRAARAPPA